MWNYLYLVIVSCKFKCDIVINYNNLNRVNMVNLILKNWFEVIVFINSFKITECLLLEIPYLKVKYFTQWKNIKFTSQVLDIVYLFMNHNLNLWFVIKSILILTESNVFI